MLQRSLCYFPHLKGHRHNKRLPGPLFSVPGDFKPNPTGHRLVKLLVSPVRDRLFSSLQTCSLVRKPDAVSGRGHGRYCNIFREIWVICRYNSKLQIVTDAFRTPSKLYPSHFILSISLIIAYWGFYPLLLTLQEDSGAFENK